MAITNTLVKATVLVTPELLAKVRAATDAITPGKKGKLTFSVDHYGTVQAGLGAKPTSWLTIGAYGARSASGAIEGAVSGTIEFDPAP